MPISTHRTYGGLVLALVPFLFACENDDFLSLPTDPGQANLDLRYARIPVPFTITQLDSIDTSPKSDNAKRLLAGAFQDTDFGTVAATNYIDFSAATSSTVGDTAQYQSLELELRYVRSYGAAQEATQSLAVLPLDQRFDDGTVYYNTSALRTDPDPLGNVTITTKVVGEVDTLRFRLDNALGQVIFDLAQDNDNIITSDSLFRRFFPGIALSSIDNSLVGSFDPSGTRLIMNFTDASNEPQELVFAIRRFFNRIEGNFAETALAGIEVAEENIIPTDGNFYLQSGTGVVPVIGMDPVIDFVSRQSRVLLNRVDLNIGLRDVGDTINLPGSLFAYEFAPDTLGQLDRVPLLDQRDGLAGYQGLNSDQGSLFLASPITLSDTRYRLAVTSYINALLEADSVSRGLYVWPNDLESSISQLATVPDSVYLDVYYTVLE